MNPFCAVFSFCVGYTVDLNLSFYHFSQCPLGLNLYFKLNKNKLLFKKPFLTFCYTFLIMPYSTNLLLTFNVYYIKKELKNDVKMQ